jgi:hypothetical protein
VFRELFDEVAEVVRSAVPDDLGPVSSHVRSSGVKVWFGGGRAAREHYEAQVLGARDVPAASVLALEVGFHSEYPDPAKNEAVLERIVHAETAWRRKLGPDAEAAPFLGHLTDWRRLSEVWPDPDLSPDDVGTEIGFRLVDYISALEPVLRRSGARAAR